MENLKHGILTLNSRMGSVNKKPIETQFLGKMEEINMTDKFKVKIPNGYLMVEEKGVENEYPGVFISFSKDGKEFDTSGMIACVEYDTSSEEIKTETYRQDFEEPNYIICYEDGRNLM